MKPLRLTEHPVVFQKFTITRIHGQYFGFEYQSTPSNPSAGIAGIDTSLYEAAKVDGASRWQQIRYITLPALVPLMVVLTILNVGKIFNSDFGLFYQVPLNTGALYPATNVISTYVYNMLMSAGTGSVGMASAAAFYQSIVGFILVMTTNFIVKKISPENALF